MTNAEDHIEQNFIRLCNELLELKRKGAVSKSERKITRPQVQRYVDLIGSKTLAEITAEKFVALRKRNFKELKI